MEQYYIEGDSITFREYLQEWTYPVRFSNFGKWFVFSTLKTICFSIPVMLLMFLLAWLAGSVAKTEPRQIVWFFSTLLLIFLLIFWTITFNHSFITPAIIKRKVTGFLQRCMPEAGELDQYSTDTWHFEWKGLPFFIAYTCNRDSINKNGYSRTVIYKYFKITTDYSSTLLYYDGTPEREEYLQDGLSVQLWDITDNRDQKTKTIGYAYVQADQEFSPNEISKALETLLAFEKTE